MTIYNQISGNKFKTYVIIALFMGIMFTFFYLLGKYVGDTTTYFTIGIIFSLVSAVGSYFYSDKLVLTMAGARPADKKEYFDYYTVTENLAIAAGLPMPKLYVIDDPAMNAFATGRNPKHAVVAATTGLLNKLERTEIEGVVAHELSHIKNYDILVSTIVAVLVGTLVFVADWVSRSFFWGGMGDSENRRTGAIGFILFLIFLFVTPFLATLIQLAISRKREYLADASGALLNRNPDALANALLKISGDPRHMRRASNATAHLFIENPMKNNNKKRNFIVNLFSTHPPVEERIRLLREM